MYLLLITWNIAVCKVNYQRTVALRMISKIWLSMIGWNRDRFYMFYAIHVYQLG